MWNCVGAWFEPAVCLEAILVSSSFSFWLLVQRLAAVMAANLEGADVEEMKGRILEDSESKHGLCLKFV